MLSGMLVKNIAMMFSEGIIDTNTISITNKRKTSKKKFNDIVVAMSDILGEKITHAKDFSSHIWAIKTNGKYDNPKLSNMYNWVIWSTILVTRTCLGYFKSLVTTWWGEIFYFYLNECLDILLEYCRRNLNT